MASVTFLTTVGGDGSTVTDDSNATTGLGNGGHRLRFIPCLTNLVNIADNTVTQATNAASSASSASSSASLASTSATNANNSFLSIDTKYLGAKTGDPALNNQGGALTTGATYWNSSTNTMRIYNGTGWENTSALTDFASNTFRVSDNSDSTKKVAFNISGITAGTVRTLTVPNASGTIALLESPTFTGTVGGITKSMVGLGNVDNTSDATKFTNPSVTGNLTFGSSGARILGDFSNASLENRTLFQDKTTNGNTLMGAIPNGTATTCKFNLFNSSTPINSSYLQLSIDSGAANLITGLAGTGSNLPLNIAVGGTTRLSIATSGAITMDTSLSVPTITTTGATGLTLTNATSNNILFYGNGAAAPTFTTRSAGTKIVLWPSLSGTAVDNAIGVGLDGPWFSTANTSSVFKWYGGTTLAATLTGTGNFTTTGTVSGSSATGFRNKIINGDFQIWQGGTSFTNPTNPATAYCADQWQAWRGAFTTGVTVTQQQTQTSSKGMRVQRNAGDTSAAILIIASVHESIDVVKLAGKTVTLQFKLKSGANFSSASSFINSTAYYGTGTDSTILSGFTGLTAISGSNYTLSSSLQQFALTFTIPNNATQFGIIWSYMPTGTAGANDWFEITDVQLEEGSVATPFERRPYGLESMLCQRYYHFESPVKINGYTNGGWEASGRIVFPTSMRASPTITITPGVLVNCSSAFASAVSATGFNLTAVATGTGVLIVGDGNTASYTASARL